MDDIYTLLERAESNSDYRYILERLRWFDGFKCPNCAWDKYYPVSTRGLRQCKQCGLQVSPTSGTVLHKVRNLRSWVRAILFFLQKDELSTVSIALLFNRSYATAWFMMHKIRFVLGQSLDHVFSTERRQFPCSTMRAALFKASSGDVHMKSANMALAKPDSDYRAGFDFEDFVRLQTFLFSMLGVFQGVSRKYSQLYAYEFSLRRDRQLLDPLRLLGCFVRGSPLGRSQLKQYFAPYMIRL